MKPTAHLETVAPGLAPGGVWVRVCTDDEELITEYGLRSRLPPPTEIATSACADGALSLAALERGVIVRNYFL